MQEGGVLADAADFEILGPFGQCGNVVTFHSAVITHAFAVETVSGRPFDGGVAAGGSVGAGDGINWFLTLFLPPPFL